MTHIEQVFNNEQWNINKENFYCVITRQKIGKNDY
jgi:hypothetical protein